jgi:quinoprotein glucose dehydrogenase
MKVFIALFLTASTPCFVYTQDSYKTLPAVKKNRYLSSLCRNCLYLLLICLFFACQSIDSPEQASKETDPLDNFTDWAIYRGDKKGLQYSELDQINTENVARLRLAWEYHHGEPGGPSMYSNPIIIDGLLYFTAPTLDVICINAASGEEVWRFVAAAHHEDKEVWRGRNRGVAYWKGAAGERIFAFVKNRVYALEAKNGRHIPSFGRNGYIDLHYDLPVDPEKASVEVTSPGIVYKDHLIVGGRVPEGYSSTPGDIRSYNAVTGEFEWIFHTVPLEGEEGYDTWEFIEGETYGGANPWGGFTMDEERGWVFCATGSPAPDFIYGGTRKGANLFGNCILALDAETGKKIWHYQNIHHDIFDYDNPPAPILASIKKENEDLDVVVQFTKMGLTFVLDRESGKPIFPVEERPVPQTQIQEETSWPTQPFPLKPPPLVRTHMSEEEITDISPEAHDYVMEIFQKYDTGPLYTPSNEKGVITMPGHQGGMEWGGGAFNPNTNLIFVNTNEAPTINRLVKFYDAELENASPPMKGAMLFQKNCTSCHGADGQGIPPAIPSLIGVKLMEDSIIEVLQKGRGNMPAFPQFSPEAMAELAAFLKSPDKTLENLEAVGKVKYGSDAPFLNDQEGYPGIKPPWGSLHALDLAKGEIVWQAPLGEYPELVKRGIRNTGTKNFGGPVATAGGLVFIAATPDKKIRAFDQKNGEVLWEHQLPAAAYATPSTYLLNGKQFLVVVCGGGGKNNSPYGDAVLAFALEEVL